MFIKLSRYRKILRKASTNKAWPDTDIEENSDSDPEYEVGEKRKKTKHVEGSFEGSFENLMQEFDQPLIEKIKLFLNGDQKFNFLSGITNIDMNIQVRKKYPVLMKILESSVGQDGTIAKPLRYDMIEAHKAILAG